LGVQRAGGALAVSSDRVCSLIRFVRRLMRIGGGVPQPQRRASSADRNKASRLPAVMQTFVPLALNRPLVAAPKSTFALLVVE
jgi:hypothetical protein